ncbi:MAG: M67 family metallopeptidase [Candidatus Hodarchaeota archaeon]
MNDYVDRGVPKPICLTRSIAERLLVITRKNHEERCALLFGRLGAKTVLFDSIAEAENILHSSTRFEIEPELVWREIIEKEKQYGESLAIGIFHTHPTGSFNPSQTDRRFMRNWDVPWLIGTRDRKPAIRAYFLWKNQIHEIPIQFLAIEWTQEMFIES